MISKQSMFKIISPDHERFDKVGYISTSASARLHPLQRLLTEEEVKSLSCQQISTLHLEKLDGIIDFFIESLSNYENDPSEKSKNLFQEFTKNIKYNLKSSQFLKSNFIYAVACLLSNYQNTDVKKEIEKSVNKIDLLMGLVPNKKQAVECLQLIEKGEYNLNLADNEATKNLSSLLMNIALYERIHGMLGDHKKIRPIHHSKIRSLPYCHKYRCKSSNFILTLREGKRTLEKQLTGLQKRTKCRWSLELDIMRDIYYIHRPEITFKIFHTPLGLKNLVFIDLKIIGFSMFSFFNELTKLFKMTPSLEKLEIFFKHHYYNHFQAIEPNMLKKFAYSFSYLRKLKSLKMNLYWLIRELFEYIPIGISHLKKLEVLSLSIHSKGLKYYMHLLKPIGDKLRNLKEFEIGQFDVHEQVSEEITRIVSANKNLHTFRFLTRHSQDHHNHQFENLINAAVAKDLKRLEMSFVTERLEKKLCDKIFQMSSLKNLTLRLIKVDITNCFDKFDSLKKLDSLEFDYEDRDGKGKQLAPLFEKLSTMKHLSSIGFRFHFFGGDYIDDFLITKLTETFKGMDHLKSLKLWLVGLTKVSLSILTNLLNVIATRNLKVLSLSLENLGFGIWMKPVIPEFLKSLQTVKRLEFYGRTKNFPYKFDEIFSALGCLKEIEEIQLFIKEDIRQNYDYEVNEMMRKNWPAIIKSIAPLKKLKILDLMIEVPELRLDITPYERKNQAIRVRHMQWDDGILPFLLYGKD